MSEEDDRDFADEEYFCSECLEKLDFNCHDDLWCINEKCELYHDDELSDFWTDDRLRQEERRQMGIMS